MINVRAVLIFIFFIRASFDPILNLTKVDIMGEDIGIGGALNLLVIIIFIFLLFQDSLNIFKNKVLRSWAIFLLICGMSIFYSPLPGRGVRVLLQLISYMSICLVPFFIIKTRDDRKLWIKILLFSSIVHIIFADWDLFKHGIHARIQGAFSHPNVLAFYIILIISIIFFILKSKEFILSRTKVNILRLYMLNLFVLLLFTKTRNAWIACSAMFFIYGLLKERKYVLYTIMIPLILSFSPIVHDRVQSAISEGPGVDNSFGWRLKMWKVAWDYIKDKFMFGYGLASFEFISLQFPPLVRGSGAHNTYIELLFETGVLGILAYLNIFRVSLLMLISRMKSSIEPLSKGYVIVIAYTVSYLIICFADNIRHYLSLNWYVWFFIGVMLVPIKSQEDETL